MVLNECLMRKKTKKKCNCVVFFLLKTKWAVEKTGDAMAETFGDFRERRSTFSLGFRPIGPSVFDGARRKVALLDEDYAWAPIWWSSDNSKW